MDISVASRLQHTEEYYFSKKLREIEQMNREGEKVINLGIGSPDLPPHPEVIDTLCEYAQKPQVHGYQSYKGIAPLREAFAKWYSRFYGVDLNADTEILPLIGSKEGIMHICMTYLEKGDAALLPNPGYPTYRSAVQLSGAECMDYELSEKSNWLPDLDALAKCDLSKVKLMWVNYPHMPTGTPANAGFFKELVAFAKQHNILLCHDNPYSFILNDQPMSLLSVKGAKEVAVELNSLSKSGNMAGWRTGVLAGKAERITEILRFKSNMDSGMFMPVQMAAVKALELDQSWYDMLNGVYGSRRKQVFALLDLLKCTYSTQQTGLFVWAKIPDTYSDGYGLCDYILEKARVFITPGGIFGSNGNGYVRISLCADENVLKNAIEKIKAIV